MLHIRLTELVRLLFIESVGSYGAENLPERESTL
jgi:hypothetical protein